MRLRTVETTSDRHKERALSTVVPQSLLEVLSGIHKGVSIPLSGNTYSIGAAPSNDIVLADSGIASEHATIRLAESVIIIEAAGGDIDLGKRRRIQRGRGCRTTLPVELKLGDAVLRIARPRATGRAWISRRSAPHLATMGGLACVLLILALYGNLPPNTVIGSSLAGLMDASAVTLDFARSAAQVRPAPSEDGMPVGSTIRAQAAPMETRIAPHEAAEALSAKLKEKGLLDIFARVNGARVIASGTISNEQHDVWGDVQFWFDRSYGGQYILASAVEVRPPAPNPKFDLQAVSFGDVPYVITADGQRRYPGAVLDQGWIIKEIRAGRLTLTKGGKEIMLSF